ncbi:acyltransferase [Kocuria sp. M1R5S2]|uniref:acyltransferase n=1 Tax=Kocuria rhizosphaerae TaxID=3376285 RepID=UPI00379BCC01
MQLNRVLPSIRGRDILAAVVAHPLVPIAARWRILRASGAEVSGAYICANVRLPGQALTIGQDTFINRGVAWDGHASLHLGERCDIAQDVLFVCATHEIGDSKHRARQRSDSPISVGDGTWIGARAVILPGVTIGPGCIIGAGAVVTHDCDANGVYVGAPARRIRDLP